MQSAGALAGITEGRNHKGKRYLVVLVVLGQLLGLRASPRSLLLRQLQQLTLALHVHDEVRVKILVLVGLTSDGLPQGIKVQLVAGPLLLLRNSLHTRLLVILLLLLRLFILLLVRLLHLQTERHE